jgi:hypothetical protein
MVIAFAFLFRLHFSSTITNTHNDLELRALSLCNKTLETQRSLGFSGITVGTTTDTTEKPFQVTTAVTQPLSWQMVVTVTANWTEATGSATHKTIARSVVLSSVVVSLN